MPHISFEYSDNLDVDVPRVLTALRDALAGQGIDVMRIKVRGIALAHTVVKDAAYGQGRMMHVTLALLAGRDVATRRAYGQALYDVMLAAVPDGGQDVAVTLEVREMDRDTYFMQP